MATATDKLCDEQIRRRKSLSATNKATELRRMRKSRKCCIFFASTTENATNIADFVTIVLSFGLAHYASSEFELMAEELLMSDSVVKASVCYFCA
ncbi:hypothetical protein COLO4_21364 [Corchorus olitorius]|uniref:Uncharacterized protein n=1 Tax=Corchorus olitorius TaxID=93759 RepID=A0A1R3ITP8_9ROSI|nr:hypothetical protein COLO4_21364 [Corchorus olitorius]